MNSSTILIPLYNTIAIPLIFIAIGLSIGALTSLINNILSSILGSVVYRSWGTIFLPGVVIHELSHALFLFVTGAKINEIVVRADSRHPWTLYRARGVRSSQGCLPNSTGHVSFRMRGPYILQSFQRVIGSIAPTVVGVGCAAGLVYVIMVYCTAWWQYAICIYLLVCVLNGSSMSTTDIKNMLPGLPVCLLVLYTVLFATQFNMFSSYPAIEALLPGLGIVF